MDYDSQCVRVLNWLKKYGSITQDDCDKWKPKCKRLASRIHDLRSRGTTIISRRESQTDEYGKEICHWTRYVYPLKEVDGAKV